MYLDRTNHQRAGWSRVFRPAALGCALLALAGCSARQYEERADREVYGIVQAVEQEVFGRINQFRIDTAWSERDPDSILAPEIIAGRTETNRLTLSLEDALDLAARQSRRYQTEKERLYLTALTLTGEQYEFGPQFFASTGADYLRSSSGERSSSLGTRIGVSQLLQTGGRLSLNLANDILRYYTGNARRETINTISVNLTQPLLRGFGQNNAAVERLTQAERNVVYAVRNFSYFQKEYAIGIVNDYFSLLGQKNVIRNTYSNYVSQVQSTKRLEARSRDRESINDVDRARSSELSARNSYVNTIASYFNSLDAFKLELGLPLNVQLYLDDSELTELQSIGLIPVNLDRNAAFRLAVERNYPLMNSIDQFEDTGRKLRIARDQLKADLNFFANASLASDGPTDYTDFDINNVRYNFGLQLDLPIDRLRERNSYRAALVNFEADIRNLALDLDSLKDRIERGVRTLEQRRQNYLIQQNALQLANRRVESSALLLEAGRGTVLDLVDAQNEQISAQNSVTSALVNYQATRLELLLTIGIVETESAKFWFRGQLEDTPELITTDTRVDFASEQPLDPDAIFKN